MVTLFFLAFAIIAEIISTIVGFGTSTILIPAYSFFIDIKTVLVLTAVIDLVGDALRLVIFRKKVDWHLGWRFVIPGAIFSYLGARLLSGVDMVTFQRVFAVFLLLYGVYLLTHKSFKLKRKPYSELVGGGISGLTAGFFGLGGAMKSVFFSAYNLDKEVYIGTSALVVAIIDMSRIIGYAQNGQSLSFNLWHLLPWLLVMGGLGVLIGRKILSLVSKEAFRPIIAMALMIYAVKIIIFS